MSDSVPSSVIKLLSKYEILQSPISQVKSERIYAGTINHNYKIVDGDNRFLLKLFTENKKLPIHRKRVFRLQEELAILSLAPQPFFLSEDNKIYCEQWIDYHPLNVIDSLDKLAEALNYVHTTYISAPSLSLSEHWKEYWLKSSLTKRHQITSRKYDSMQEKWNQYYKKYSDEFVLCHNDLHISHVCDSEGPYLDWEYAGLGCRYFDIASCCIINQLDAHQTNVLCNKYAIVAGIKANDVINRVSQVSEFVNFTNTLWVKALNVTDENIDTNS